MKKLFAFVLILMILIGFVSCSENDSICWNCKEENQTGSVYCSFCGVSLPKSFICRFCDTQNKNGSKYCNQCGESLLNEVSVDVGDIDDYYGIPEETTTSK